MCCFDAQEKKRNLGHKFESGMEKNKATRKLLYKIKEDKIQYEEIKASQNYEYKCL